MKQRTDITEFIKRGGQIKYGKTKRAVGAEFFYAIPKDDIKQITKVDYKIAAHMSVKRDYILEPKEVSNEKEKSQKQISQN